MRSKEGSSDYRYFPDPDLGLIEVCSDLREKWRLELPELDDPALRMGYIPFAKLKTRINSNELVSHLLKVKQSSTNYTELFNG